MALFHPLLGRTGLIGATIGSLLLGVPFVSSTSGSFATVVAII
jgi:hypothetical protein